MQHEHRMLVFSCKASEAFAQEVPAIIDCPVDYAENMKLSAYLKNLA